MSGSATRDERLAIVNDSDVTCELCHRPVPAEAADDPRWYMEIAPVIYSNAPDSDGYEAVVRCPDCEGYPPR